MKSFTDSLANACLLLMLCLILGSGLQPSTTGLTYGNDDIELPAEQQEAEDTCEMDDDDAIFDHRLVGSADSKGLSVDISSDFNYLLVLQEVVAPPPEC